MALIYETKNFTIDSKDRPEVDRLEGGHIIINPKKTLEDRQQLSPEHAIEMMRLSVIAGDALKKAMTIQGVNIGRINYQDNGNWSPRLHIHIYGRAKDAKMQKYGDPIIPGHKPEYKPLNQEDITEIKKQIEILLKQDKYKESNWKLI